jgi:hypothetical protein
MKSMNDPKQRIVKNSLEKIASTSDRLGLRQCREQTWSLFSSVEVADIEMIP